MASQPLPYDLQTAIVGVREAAELAFGVPEGPADVADRQRLRNEARIRKWKERGHLVPVDTDADGKPQFIAISVLRAQASAAGADPSRPLEERARYRPELRARIQTRAGV